MHKGIEFIAKAEKARLLSLFLPSGRFDALLGWSFLSSGAAGPSAMLSWPHYFSEGPSHWLIPDSRQAGVVRVEQQVVVLVQVQVRGRIVASWNTSPPVKF